MLNPDNATGKYSDAIEAYPLTLVIKTVHKKQFFLNHAWAAQHDVFWKVNGKPLVLERKQNPCLYAKLHFQLSNKI